MLAVRWTPDLDAGASWYDYQVIVGSNAANPRCFGRITMADNRLASLHPCASAGHPVPVPRRAVGRQQRLASALQAMTNAVLSTEYEPGKHRLYLNR